MSPKDVELSAELKIALSTVAERTKGQSTEPTIPSMITKNTCDQFFIALQQPALAQDQDNVFYSDP